MDSWLSHHFSFRERISLLCLIFLLTSCGSGTPALDTPVGATSTATAQALKPAYNYDKSQTISGLFIKLHGFICTEGPFLSNLTISTSQLSYDAGSAQIIQNYIQLLANNANASPDTSLVTSWIPPRPPKEVQWVPGSTTCTGNLAITNTTHTSIEVQRFGMQLTAAPIINAYHYRRVPLQSLCSGCGGSAPCAYRVSVPLNGGVTGSHFDSPIMSTDNVQCPLPIIIPALLSTELSITFRDAQKRDMIYTGMPTLTIEGKQPVALSALTSRLFFTHTDKLPCYQFQGNAFVTCLQS